MYHIDPPAPRKPKYPKQDLPPVPKGYKPPKHFLYSDEEDENFDEEENDVDHSSYSSQVSQSDDERVGDNHVPSSQSIGMKKKAVTSVPKEVAPPAITSLPPMTYRGFRAFQSNDPLPAFPTSFPTAKWRTIMLPKPQSPANAIDISKEYVVPAALATHRQTTTNDDNDQDDAEKKRDLEDEVTRFLQSSSPILASRNQDTTHDDDYHVGDQVDTDDETDSDASSILLAPDTSTISTSHLRDSTQKDNAPKSNAPDSFDFSVPQQIDADDGVSLPRDCTTANDGLPKKLITGKIKLPRKKR